MRSKKISISPGMLLALVLVFMIASVSASTAASSLINGKKIKKGTIAYSALSKDAKKQLAKSSKAGPQGAPGAQGPAGAAAPTYWAMINQDGSVARSSAGVTSTQSLNSGYYQYRVSFPREVSSCGYSATTGDPGAIGTSEFTIPSRVAASRSTQGPNTIAVNVFDFGSGTTTQDSFFLGLYC